MTKKINRVGIDVGSKELFVSMKRADNTIINEVFANTKVGHKKFLNFITKNKCHAKVCMEATGIYHFDLAVMLSNSGVVEVMVVNPRAIKHFGTAMMQRTKTDKVDCCIILEYLCRMDFVQWICPDDNILQIQSFSRRLFHLKKQLVQEQNRLIVTEFRGPAGKFIKKSINKHITHLKKSIDEMQQELSSLIQSIPKLKSKYDLLISVKGLADVSVCQILAELLMLPDDLQAKQWVAFAGLDPKTNQSGVSIDKPKKITRQGNKYIRAALYMPSLVAIKHDANVKAYYEKLISSGKKKKSAIVAIMRKMLLAIWGILNSGTKWQGERFYTI